jgi:hypothetical protein
MSGVALASTGNIFQLAHEHSPLTNAANPAIVGHVFTA